MRLIKQSGPHCLVTSAAMILDTTPEQLHSEIGTTGEDIWWPPSHMRGIHIQEIQDCCLRRNRCLYPIEINPLLAPDSTGLCEARECYPEKVRLPRLKTELRFSRAILITDNHAVAWDGRQLFDPKGFIKSFEDYQIHEAWVLAQVMML